MKNRNPLRSILLFCLASVGIAVALAVVSSLLTDDNKGVDQADSANTLPRRASGSQLTNDPVAQDLQPRRYLEEYSVHLVNQDGEKIGTVRIASTSQGVSFNIFARKLWPGAHAIHLYEHGRCEGPDFASAGGHFNPTNAVHGVPDYDTDVDEQDHHIGDMRGDRANSQGQLNHRATNASVTLGPTIGGRYSIADDDGTALVITYGADDSAAQSEAEMPRVACAVITEPKPQS